jgi:methionyl-tRNA synthetase
MSKSKGTFVNARTYLDHLPPEALRYYYAAKLGGTTDDLDLNLADFVQRVNSDLVGKITNIASRGGQMLQKKLGGRLGSLDAEGRALFDACVAAGETIARHYEDRRFNQAVVEICRLADAANEYFDRRAPWKTVKTDEEATRTTLTAALNAFRVLAIYLQPILPVYADKARAFFGEEAWTWLSRETPLEGRTLGAYEYLASRIETKQVEAMVAAATVAPAETGEVAHASRPSKEKNRAARAVPALKPEIAFADFDKVDLRVGRVTACEAVPKSAKLLKITLACGELGERTIFSGIRGAYPDPSALVGREVVFVANLAPRKMSVGVSEGMILFAGEPGASGGVLSPDGEAGAGAVAN